MKQFIILLFLVFYISCLQREYKCDSHYHNIDQEHIAPKSVWNFTIKNNEGELIRSLFFHGDHIYVPLFTFEEDSKLFKINVRSGVVEKLLYEKIYDFDSNVPLYFLDNSIIVFLTKSSNILAP